MALLLVVLFFTTPGISHGSETRIINSIRPGRIEVTLEYRNALLDAILPRIADCAQKLGVSLPMPLTTNHVAGFWPARDVYADRRNPGEQIVSFGIGGNVALTNGMLFEFDRGRIVRFVRRPKDDPSKAILAKQIRFNRKQALEVARRAIEAMGCDPADVYADLQPEVHEPAEFYGKIYALYDFRWHNPASDGSGWSARVRINGETGEVDSVWLLGAPALPAPALAVYPNIIPDPERAMDLSGADKEAACRNLMPEINGMAEKLRVPIELPVTMASVKWVNAWKDGLETRNIDLNVLLTNGYRFARHGGHTTLEFWAPDAFFGEPHVRARELFGKWRVGKRAAVKMARDAVVRLGLDQAIYSTKKRPEIEKPFLAGEAVIPRYLVTWRRQRGYVQVEIDAEKGRVVALSYGLMNDVIGHNGSFGGISKFRFAKEHVPSTQGTPALVAKWAD